MSGGTPLRLGTADSLFAGRGCHKGELKVEIKATQGQRVALRSGPEHLLVLKLDRRGGFWEVYNGPGRPVWKELERKPRPSNGQYQVSLKRLKAVMQQVPEGQRLPMLVPNNARKPTGFSAAGPEPLA